MSEEPDRVVTDSRLKSALNDLETRITERLEKRLAEDGETTRRHFDIMVEKVNDSVRLVAEVTAHHATVLDDHEAVESVSSGAGRQPSPARTSSLAVSRTAGAAAHPR